MKPRPKPSSARLLLWSTCTGSRAQRKKKVNALVRLGYNGPAKTLADEINRDFQVKALLRPRIRHRHTRKLDRATADRLGEF